ncbi:MAG TPA: thiamine pyrophosphate-dependent dehydrogenase E1 component subunit alpha [Rhodoglobus sp.]|nr:thiamine pyrophosphate-dependent dehydrogenase E1 component subunit alpha [Rhodoglobus sp.]
MTDVLEGRYRRMLLIRTVEDRVMQALTQGLVSGSTHLCIGQEAVPVGACEAMRDDDPLIATYRGHGWLLARGVEPTQLFAEILGRESTLNGGRAGSAYMSAAAHHVYGENSIVGGGVPIAVGLGLACRSAADGRLPIVSIGDGAMNQGNVHESLNMASVLRIPLIVVVENNGYAEMTPSSMLTAVPAAVRAAAYGIQGVEVDGNDPTAVFDVVTAARSSALATQRPVLVEAHTHRLAGHYSGDAQVYRPAGELDQRRQSDPLLLARRHLPDARTDAIDADVERLVQEAFEAALNVEAPSAKEAGTHVYSS